MKFGIVLPSYGPQASRPAVMDCASAAESLGFDSIWTTDHILLPQSDGERFGIIFESITTLAYLAAVTSRVRLGISSLVLPQRNPIEVAKQMATLDVLSGGRAVLAVAVGWSRGEYANLGYTFQDRGKRMDEYIQVLRALWGGGPVVSFSGKYYHFEDAAFAPGSLQAGGPELWVGGNSPAALRRAGLLADGWHPDSLEPDVLYQRLAKARPLLLDRPFTISMRGRLDFQAQPGERFLAGSPEQVAEKLRALQDAGLTYLLVDIRAASPAARERAMQTFAHQVMPALS